MEDRVSTSYSFDKHRVEKICVVIGASYDSFHVKNSKPSPDGGHKVNLYESDSFYNTTHQNPKSKVPSFKNPAQIYKHR